MGKQFLFCSIFGITEEEEVRPQIIVVPVPVPVFVPVPLHLYTQYTPVPLGMPVPVSLLSSLEKQFTALFLSRTQSSVLGFHD